MRPEVRSSDALGKGRFGAARGLVGQPEAISEVAFCVGLVEAIR